ncbi:XkdX family protein [Staphylococcus equorum]|uniref:XkdX family protein n=1 Tax=Staphylococcus equorum TaxID=246432 RepID=UPI00101BBC02|nr:XkdX family protein [Staphylococcus equorum]RYD13619.1 hypothetical protein CGA19_01775 [Staphylococcus equorum]
MKKLVIFIVGFALGKMKGRDKDTLFNVIAYNYKEYLCDKDDLYFYVNDDCISKKQYLYITGEDYPEQPQV